MEYDLLVKLIPPAIALSVLAYFVSFFGKVIADQQPFADDRKWYTQIAGGMFVLNVIFGSIIGVFIANALPLRIESWIGHAISLLVLSFISTALYFHNARESSRLFNYRTKINEEFDKKLEGIPSLHAKFGKYALPSLVPVVVSYFIALEYFTGNEYMLLITAIVAFYIFFWSAFQYSLRKLNDIAPINIYFNNKDFDPILGAQVLKYNDDNIRIRTEDKILILNKSEVFKIEMKIPDSLL